MLAQGVARDLLAPLPSFPRDLLTAHFVVLDGTPREDY